MFDSIFIFYFVFKNVIEENEAKLIGEMDTLKTGGENDGTHLIELSSYFSSINKNFSFILYELISLFKTNILINSFVNFL